ncbi:MAG: RnfABCDGE type electron transport complex subunit D [Firmicutes bacterium]|nr:RnfABCDGE type electron transport complex subunit D [Bacillota bacterium]
MEGKQILHGPVIRTADTTKRIMWDVVLALIPAWIAGVIFFGVQAVWIVILSTFTAVITEALILRYPFTLKTIFGDGSSVVTGLLLGLILPSTVPWWIPIIGSVFAIILGKLIYGGLGNNIFNPALVGRAILALGFTSHMVKYAAPFDAVTQATPLMVMRKFDWSLIWGNVGGCIGETSVIAILLGGLYLFYRGHIGWRIPLGCLVTAFATAWLWGLDPWMAVTAGGLLFAAVFMATDMVTSPVTPMGRLLFGCGCGFLTIFLRRFTAFPEGVTFAVLIMNAVVPLLDRLTVPVIFGASKSREQRFRTTAAVVVIIIIAGCVLAVINKNVPEHKMTAAEGVYLPLAETLGSEDYQLATIEDKVYYYVGDYEAPEKVGFIGSEQGYHGPIYFYLVVDGSGSILHLQILSHSDDPGLGSLVTRDTFLDQFIGLNYENDLTLGADVMGVTGATISSRAVISGINTELQRFITAFYGDNEKEEPIKWIDGVYAGQANSFGGIMQVEVTIGDGRIADVKILEHQDTVGISDEAILLIPERIVTANNPDVDAVAQATVSSKGIIAAVKDALSKAAVSDLESDAVSGKGAQ